MSKALRVGLIGAGGISRAHLRAYQQFPDQVELVAVCDINEAAARQRAGEAGVEAVYTDAAAMLRQAALDAVDICTIHDQHAPLAIAAAETGKHVLVEKPMACSMQECRAMVAAAEKAGVTLMVAQDQRYRPSYQGVKRLIDEGELGRIHGVRFDSMQNLLAFLPPGHWLYDGKRAGGGIVISVSVHRIDLMRYLIGDIKSVSGLTRVTRPEFTNGAEDFAVATFEFENGALGETFATYSGFRMPWSEMFMILGECGAVHAVPAQGESAGPALVASLRLGSQDDQDGWNKQFRGFVPVEPVQEGLPTEDGKINEILHFALCCRTGKEPLSSGKDNLGTMKTIFGIYESAQTGRTVQLADL